MNELIQVKKQIIGKNEINAVNARDLHKFLGIKKDFTTWIKGRISEYDFKEGQDYLLTKIGEQVPSGTKYKTEYFISLDMAKELCMVEKNDRGKEARKYFIECEKKYKEQHEIPKTYAEALQLAADQARVIEEQRPKVEFFEKYVNSTGLYTLTATAKKLNIKRKDLIECLIRDKAIFRRQNRIEPYSDKVSKGLFELKTGEANGHAYDQIYITSKGFQWVTESYKGELAN